MAEQEMTMEAEAETELDKIQSLVQSVENMNAEQALDALADALEQKGDVDFFTGGVLAAIQGNKLWKEMGDYSSFKDFVVTFMGVEYRKATYLINNYEGLVEAEVPWEDVSHLGWSKLKEIAPILTKANAAEWIEKATNCTVLQLQELVKEAKKVGLETTEVPVEQSNPITSVSFKCFSDQKETIKQAVKQAKGEAETDSDAVALEAICLNYLGGGMVKPPSLVQVIESAGLHDALQAIEALWPDVDIEVALPAQTKAADVEEVGEINEEGMSL